MADQPEAPALVNYTVLQAAVTLSTGKIDPRTKSPEVVRLVQHDTFNAPADHPTVLNLRSMKAIRETSKFTGKEQITAKTVMLAFKQSGEDIAAVVEGVVPVNAPMPLDDAHGPALTSADL